MQDGQLERLARSNLANTEADRAVATESLLHEWRPAGSRMSNGQVEDGRGGREGYSSAESLIRAGLDGQRISALGVVAFSQLFPLGIALAREFIGQLENLESS